MSKLEAMDESYRNLVENFNADVQLGNLEEKAKEYNLEGEELTIFLKAKDYLCREGMKKLAEA